MARSRGGQQLCLCPGGVRLPRGGLRLAPGVATAAWAAWNRCPAPLFDASPAPPVPAGSSVPPGHPTSRSHGSSLVRSAPAVVPGGGGEGAGLKPTTVFRGGGDGTAAPWHAPARKDLTQLLMRRPPPHPQPGLAPWQWGTTPVPPSSSSRPSAPQDPPPPSHPNTPQHPQAPSHPTLPSTPHPTAPSHQCPPPPVSHKTPRTPHAAIETELSHQACRKSNPHQPRSQ